MRLLAALLIFANCNCANAAPPKPKPPVVVEKFCALPPIPPLPVPRALGPEQGCPAELLCFDQRGAQALLQRILILQSWIREAAARCGPPPKQPKPAATRELNI